MKFTVLMMFGLVMFVSGCASNAVQPSQKKCEDEYMYAYNLHNQAIEAARKGECEESANKFMSTIDEMAYLSTRNYCDQNYRQAARDGYYRAIHDARLLKSKFCPDVKITIPAR